MNRYGKNEERGPSIRLDELLGPASTRPCEVCDNGHKAREVVNGANGSDACHACGRLLMPDSV